MSKTGRAEKIAEGGARSPELARRGIGVYSRPPAAQEP